MEKTKYTVELRVETISVLPRTLVVEKEKMPVGTINTEIFAVYGHDPATRKVWVATFIDEQEAEVFVMSSKTFGRPVLGAVLGGQEGKLATTEAQKGAEMSDDAVEAPTDATRPS